MKWTLVSMTFARSMVLHYFSMLLYFFGTIFLVCALEVKSSTHGPFSGFFPDSFINGQIDGISTPLAAGILLILFGIIFHFGLSGQLRIRKNEKEEKGLVYSSITGRMELFPMGRVEFRMRKTWMPRLRRMIIVTAIFYNENDEAKLVIVEHSNSLFIIDKYYTEGGKSIPISVPRKFGSVRTLKQLWMEKGWEN